jgi:hypothetical protein
MIKKEVINNANDKIELHSHEREEVIIYNKVPFDLTFFSLLFHIK